MKDGYRLTKEDFNYIYGKVPRLNVELVIRGDKGVLLTKRTIEPCKGLWHLPGGTVYYGDSFMDTVKRIAKRELDISVKEAEMIGYIEYSEHVKSGYGDPRGLSFLITDYRGEIVPNDESDGYEWFNVLPENMHPHQGEFLLSKNLIEKSTQQIDFKA